MTKWRIPLAWTTPFSLAALALALILPTGCTAKDEHGEIEVPTSSETAVTTQVNQLARQITDVAGKGHLKTVGTNAAACENSVNDTSESIVYVQGAYNISLPRAEHKAAFLSARDHWEKAGWKIFRSWFKDKSNEGSLTAKDPQTTGSFTLSSTKSADTLAVIIQSGCFRRAGSSANQR